MVQASLRTLGNWLPKHFEVQHHISHSSCFGTEDDQRTGLRPAWGQWCPAPTTFKTCALHFIVGPPVATYIQYCIYKNMPPSYNCCHGFSSKLQQPLNVESNFGKNLLFPPHPTQPLRFPEELRSFDSIQNFYERRVRAIFPELH